MGLFHLQTVYDTVQGGISPRNEWQKLITAENVILKQAENFSSSGRSKGKSHSKLIKTSYFCNPMSEKIKHKEE